MMVPSNHCLTQLEDDTQQQQGLGYHSTTNAWCFERFPSISIPAWHDWWSRLLRQGQFKYQPDDVGFEKSATKETERGMFPRMINCFFLPAPDWYSRETLDRHTSWEWGPQHFSNSISFGNYRVCLNIQQNPVVQKHLFNLFPFKWMKTHMNLGWKYLNMAKWWVRFPLFKNTYIYILRHGAIIISL